jgi:hypothetical protein
MMDMNTKNLLVGAVLAAGAAFGLSGQAFAQVSMNVTYFTVAESGDPDFNTNPCCISTPWTNEVQGTLGPNGFPVYNPSYPGPTLYDVNTTTGELTWWNPALNSHVTQTGLGVVTLPYANYNFFPPNGTGSNDANGFQAAIFRGQLVVPSTEAVTFSFGADDDAFLALGNTVISQEGGIHGVAAAPVVTPILTPGTYDLTLFYTDRHQTGAGLYFSLDTSGVTINPIGAPEPATWAMMLVGFGGLGAALRSRRRPLAAKI